MKTAKITSVVVFLVALLLSGYCYFVVNAGTDHEGPQIQMDSGEIQVSISAGEEELLAGVTATDRRDGDVTVSLAVESISNFIEKGRRKVTIVAFDSDHNVSRVTREMVYTDYVSPTFSLSKPLKFSRDTNDMMEGLSATDCLDGDLSSKIQITYEEGFSYNVMGAQKVIYSVSNSAGDVVNLPVTIELYDPTVQTSQPELRLSEYLINVPVGTAVNPWDYLDSVTVNGRTYEKAEDGQLHGVIDEEEVLGSDQVMIENPLDANTPGVYEIAYSMTDEEGASGTVRLIVSVNG
ncbi:MAG: hypothetical protein MR332_03690 [Fusicatenibacter sp.]|nr:hypothetical protein [Fusicatenibacter sp.]